MRRMKNKQAEAVCMLAFRFGDLSPESLGFKGWELQVRSHKSGMAPSLQLHFAMVPFQK